MKNVLIAVLSVSTVFLGAASYMQANGQLVYNPQGVYRTSYTKQDTDQLTALLESSQIIAEK